MYIWIYLHTHAHMISRMPSQNNHAIHRHARVQLHTHTCTHKYTHIHTEARQSRMRTPTPTHRSTTNTYTHTHSHTHENTYKYTHREARLHRHTTSIIHSPTPTPSIPSCKMPSTTAIATCGTRTLVSASSQRSFQLPLNWFQYCFNKPFIQLKSAFYILHIQFKLIFCIRLTLCVGWRVKLHNLKYTSYLHKKHVNILVCNQQPFRCSKHRLSSVTLFAHSVTMGS